MRVVAVELHSGSNVDPHAPMLEQLTKKNLVTVC